jgi:N-acetyl-anhydromuramyl-L-alanine amidase AmpD
VHHTGGEGDAAQVHRVLTERGLSVHFYIDHGGVVYQFCDADAYCSHASGANGYSVGIEIANRANAQADHAKWERDLTRETIHGQTSTATRFYPAQIAAAIALCESLSKAYGLPLCVPEDVSGMPLARVMSKGELAAYRGIMGHLHCTTKGKRDPGLEILREMQRAWTRAE